MSNDAMSVEMAPSLICDSKSDLNIYDSTLIYAVLFQDDNRSLESLFLDLIDDL